MVAELTKEQVLLLGEVRRRGTLTVTEAWKFGYSKGFYKGGDGPKTKEDLNALVGHRVARRVDGFWRHINEPDKVRLRYLRWSDNWVPR